MAKNFAPRTSKKEREKVSVSSVSSDLSKKLFKINDDKLLRGAKLADIKLNDIHVREQVRTKFNEESLRELGENIKANGLIQPLVLHREGDKFVLICGERRYRAMKLINKVEAPCFILEDKTKEELMAIQFSENQAREELHYIDKADGIYNYQVSTGSSERKIQSELGISKTEVHRSLLLAKLSDQLKEAAKAHNIEKYVLLEFDALDGRSPLKPDLETEILNGKITKRSQLKRRLLFIQEQKKVKAIKGTAKSPKVLKIKTEKEAIQKISPSARAFIKVMNGHSKNLKMDKQTRELMKKIIKESSEILQT
jgi:ParB family chromosome partitioning protein